MSFDFFQNKSNFTRERLEMTKIENIKKKLDDIWTFAKFQLMKSQNTQQRFANRHRENLSEYQVENQIWLSIKNIKIERENKDLNHKIIDSFKILRVFESTCQLKLSSSMKIYNTFHTSLLRSATTNSLLEQISSETSLVIIDDKEKRELDDILNTRLSVGLGCPKETRPIPTNWVGLGGPRPPNDRDKNLWPNSIPIDDSISISSAK